MPYYEFQCPKCGKIVEKYYKTKKDIDIVKCDVCDIEMKRILSPTSFTLKGGGWSASGYSKEKK
jgi:putative FmdB family regulatory protein